MPRKHRFSYFQKRALRRKTTRIVVENLTNSIKSVKCRSIATLIKIHYDDLVTFHNISYLWYPPSAPSACVFFARKQLQKRDRTVIPDKCPKLCRCSCAQARKQISSYLQNNIISFQSDLEPFKSSTIFLILTMSINHSETR